MGLELRPQVVTLMEKMQALLRHPTSTEPRKISAFTEPIVNQFDLMTEAEKNQSFDLLLGFLWELHRNLVELSRELYPESRRSQWKTTEHDR